MCVLPFTYFPFTHSTKAQSRNGFTFCFRATCSDVPSSTVWSARSVRHPNALRERGNHFFHGGDDLIVVAEVIQHDDPSAGSADADHFTDYLAVVGDSGDDVGRDDCVETIVLEFHRAGIHPVQLHVAHPVFCRSLLRFVQHAF